MYSYSTLNWYEINDDYTFWLDGDGNQMKMELAVRKVVTCRDAQHV